MNSLMVSFARRWIDDVVEVTDPDAEAGLIVELFVESLALFGRDFQRRAGIRTVNEAAVGFPAAGEDFRVARLDLPLFLRGDRPVAQRRAVVGGALEDRDVRRGVRDLGDDLHAGRPGTHHATRLPVKSTGSFGQLAVWRRTGR